MILKTLEMMASITFQAKCLCFRCKLAYLGSCAWPPVNKEWGKKKKKQGVGSLWLVDTPKPREVGKGHSPGKGS